jgi:hypothetical protein
MPADLTGTVLVDDQAALHPPFHPGPSAHPGRGNDLTGQVDSTVADLSGTVEA